MKRRGRREETELKEGDRDRLRHTHTHTQELDIIMRFLDGDSILGQDRCKVFHRQGKSLIFPLDLAAALLGATHLAVLQCIIGDVRHKLLSRQGDQTHPGEGNRVICSEVV